MLHASCFFSNARRNMSADISEEMTMLLLHGVMLFLRLPIHVRPRALSSVNGRALLNCNRLCSLPTCVPDFAIASLSNQMRDARGSSYACQCDCNLSVVRISSPHLRGSRSLLMGFLRWTEAKYLTAFTWLLMKSRSHR